MSGHSTPSLLLLLNLLSQFNFTWDFSSEEIASLFLRIEIIPFRVFICIIKSIELSSGVRLILLIMMIIVSVVIALVAAGLLEISRFTLVRPTLLLEWALGLCLGRFERLRHDTTRGLFFCLFLYLPFIHHLIKWVCIARFCLVSLTELRLVTRRNE